MVWALRNILLIAFLSGIAVTASADDYRALTNYKLHCQGCHMPDMQGAIGAVPRMKNFLGYFLHSPEGRGYIAQVPGVTMSSLKNDDLAELLNWMLLANSKEQLPASFKPYTTAEVAELRKTPSRDPLAERTEILDDVATQLPILADEIERDGYAY